MFKKILAASAVLAMSMSGVVSTHETPIFLIEGSEGVEAYKVESHEVRVHHGHRHHHRTPKHHLLSSLSEEERAKLKAISDEWKESHSCGLFPWEQREGESDEDFQIRQAQLAENREIMQRALVKARDLRRRALLEAEIDADVSEAVTGSIAEIALSNLEEEEEEEEEEE